MNAAYFNDPSNIHKELHGYDRSKNPFLGNNRHVNNTVGLIDWFDAYCDSQEEFDEWMVWLKNAKDSYRSVPSVNKAETVRISEEYVM